MYTRKSLLNFEFSFWTKSKFGFRTFFWLSVAGKLSLFFWKMLSPGVLDLFVFSKQNNFFDFRKDALRLGSNIFETFGFAPKKISRWKNLFYFSTSDVFVPVSQLSTRDLFYFLENLKIRQDILSWISRLVRSLDRRALWFSYSRLFFGIVFKKVLFLEYLGCLQSQSWCQY
jgi:hypothetical protein